MDKQKQYRWAAMAGLCVVFLGVASAVAFTMWKLRPEQEKKEPQDILPTVETLQVYPEDLVVKVETQGTVEARTETVLTAEVSGLVEWVSPDFVAGGFFEKGEVLLKIDALEYESRLAEARSRLAQAELVYAQERALAEQAARDWEDLGRGEPTDLVLRKPQLAKAKADREAAEAALRIAERNLRFTEVRAPYAGRVRRKRVDVGQSITARASQLAEIYSVEVAEIRLPLSAKEAGFLRLPERYRDGATGPYPRVVLRAEFGGDLHEWEGTITRTEGAIDTRSRLLNVVAEVEDPYSLSREEGEPKPPLRVGLFVEAEIEGIAVDGAYRLPRSVLREGDRVYVLGPENRLQSREVGVVKTDADSVIVDSGLQPGDALCLTPLLFFTEGMRVQPVDDAGEIQESPGGRKGRELEVAESPGEEGEA